MIYKATCFAFALLALGACVSNSPEGSILSEVGDNLPSLKNAEAPVSARYTALFESDPDVGLLVGFPADGKRSGMLREVKDGTIENFLGTDEASVVLDRGMLVGTRGVGTGMLGSDVNPSADLVLGGRNGTVERIHTFLVRDNKTDIRAYRCQITQGDTETIKVFKRSFRVRAVTESCVNLTQKFENIYLVSTATNRIIRSSQWTGPVRGNLLMDYVVFPKD